MQIQDQDDQAGSARGGNRDDVAAGKRAQVDKMKASGRWTGPAQAGDDALGALALLPGTWKNVPNLPGRGWNMIALPFVSNPPSPLNYRLLLNQYNEELTFSLVDKAVPNRGISTVGQTLVNSDQFIAALHYQQSITQIAAEDSPVSGLAGNPGLPIHLEPGLWLHMLNQTEDGNDLARLATIPHGDSVLALGSSAQVMGPPTIPVISGLPLGVSPDLNGRYLAPYNHFHTNPFRNLFDPTIPNALLTAANQGVNIVKTTVLTVDTTIPSGSITNIPFVIKQANAASMKSTFWIQELAEKDKHGKPKLRLQYSQVVMLDFFPRRDGMPGRIAWPHISINTMEKVK